MTGDDLTRLQKLGNALERTADGRWQMPDTALMTRGERQWLQDRQAILQRSIVRGSRDAIAAAVAGMLLRFPQGTHGETEGRVAAYVADLQSFPLWAIEKAIAGVRGQWAPASNVLVEAVRVAMSPTTDEMSKLHRLLTAEVYHVPDEAERKRIDARMRQMQVAFGATDHDPEKVRIEAQEALLKFMREPKPAISLSHEALRSCGIRPAQQDQESAA